MSKYVRETYSQVLLTALRENLCCLNRQSGIRDESFESFIIRWGRGGYIMEGGGRNFIWGSAVGLEINNPWSRGRGHFLGIWGS